MKRSGRTADPISRSVGTLSVRFPYLQKLSRPISLTFPHLTVPGDQHQDPRSWSQERMKVLGRPCRNLPRILFTVLPYPKQETLSPPIRTYTGTTQEPHL